MDSFADLIDALGSRSDLARECGIGPMAVQGWLMRDQIPPGYWLKVVDYARERDVDIDVDTLAVWAERHVYGTPA